MTLYRLLAALLCASSASLAYAEIYTWVDASGNVTLSNLAPPSGVRVTNVTRAAAPSASAARDAARTAQMEELVDRVQQLERDVEAARSAAAPPVVYPMLAAPPAQYAPTPPYVEAPPSPAYDCDPTWAGCWSWMAPPLYAAPIVVLGSHGRHFRGGHRAGSRPPAHAPVRTSPRTPAGQLIPQTFALRR